MLSSFHQKLFCAQNWSVSDIFSIADPDSIKLWDQLVLSDSLPEGYPLLRTEIAKLYPGFSADHVICYNSLWSVICSLQDLIGSQKRMALVTPTHPLLLKTWQQFASTDTISSENPHSSSEVPSISRRILETSLKRETSLLALAVPSCPWGTCPSQSDQEDLIDWARKKNLYLVNDEQSFWIAGNTRVHSIANLYEKGISLGSIGPSFGMPGLNIFWIVSSNPKILEILRKTKEKQGVSASLPSEVIATTVLRSRDLILKCNQAIITQNLQILESIVVSNSNQISWIRPHGGCIASLTFQTSEVSQFFENQCLQFQEWSLPPSLFGFLGQTQTWGIGVGQQSIRHPLYQWISKLQEKYP